MAHRQINVSQGKLFTTLLIIAVAFQVTPHDYTKRLNFFFRSMFAPILKIGMPGLPKILRPAASTGDVVKRKEYDELLKEYQNTRAQLLELQKRYEELAQMRAGLPIAGPLVLASVVTSAISDFGHEVYLNAGTAAGLRVGQIVLDGGGTCVIGSISEVSEAGATVQLVTDSRHAMKVAIWRKGREDYVERRMVGDGKDGCKIPLVSREYDVRVGDAVFAAPQQGLLDSPMVIGEVAAVKPDEKEPLLWDITIRPLFDRESLNRVGIVVMNPRAAP
ncbi:MAG TPA: rod shape-determining protein MreC [Anaerohalosphaeraceae bacterium]|jgi:cell shape-determining protein MreC|nr:rod shape-determining protein MreC [Anaerohalosphaeraceae bacterium]HRT51761.1 rod shape-determining protein MreC [Anaerohalosphaeraceae bacterium]HRT87736.1 rod shape-determining protein MreC [Anaerohalosphaeraceae bacterium]